MKKNRSFLITISILLFLFSAVFACTDSSEQSNASDNASSESEMNTQEEITTEELQEIENQETEVSYIDESLSAGKASFAENIFTFNYPSNWSIIDSDDIDYLFDTSLSGGSRSSFDYLGGIYIGERWEEDIGESSFTVYIISDSSFAPQISDEQYQSVKNNYQSQFGDRLLGLEKTDFNGYEAFDIKTIGNSMMTQSWQKYVMSEGKVFVLTFMSRIELYEAYQVIFSDILDSFDIQEY